MIIRFSHIMLYTHDITNSVKWYQEKLGFEIDYHAVGEYCSMHHPQLGRLALHADKEPQVKTNMMPYFLCDDIHKTIADLKAKGVKVGTPTREGESPWFCDFYDNVGTCWGLEEM